MSRFEGKGGGSGRSISLASSRAKIAAATATTNTSTKKAVVRGKCKAAKKVFSLTNQKFEAPEEREPLRIFYESLSKQIPSSEMAEFWLMEHGLLSPERAKKAYDRKLKRQQLIKSGIPVKCSTNTNTNTVTKHNKPASETWKKPVPASSPSATSRFNTQHSAAKAKRKVEDSDDDATFRRKGQEESRGQRRRR